MIAIAPSAAYALGIGALLSWDGWPRVGEKFSRGESVGAVAQWSSVLLLLIVCFAAVASTTHQPFLYFRF